jgi:hypothetical protein
MKNFYLFIVSIFFFNFLFAAPVIIAKQNGSWSNINTWDKGRVPKDADTIVVPAGKLVTFDDWATTEVLKGVYIKVYGTLRIGGLLSVLSLDDNSSIVIYTGGALNSSGLWQSIMIGTKTVFASTSPAIVGPQIANSGTLGFTPFNPLPVKFVGFTVTRKNNDAYIQWSTSEEMNAETYEVERSLDGNNWNTIAYVAAAGNSSIINSYSCTDKNISAKIIHYRIKQVDADGTTAFTAIKSIRMDITSSADIKIASVQNKVLLQFPNQVKGKLLVRFVSLSGQVVDQQTISNPVGQVVLNSKVTGNYIISISNGQDMNTAKQIIL